MHKPRSLILLLCCIALSGSSRACQCLHIPKDFFASLQWVQQNNPTLQGLFVVRARMLTPVGGHGVRFRILDRFLGNTIPDTVTVWSDPGWLCRFSPRSAYQCPGDTILAVLRQAQLISPPESPDDYEINGCGFFHLLQKGDTVYGGHVTSFTAGGYPLGAFMDSLSKVLTPLPVSEEPGSGSAVLLYHNPAGDLIYIQTGREPVLSLEVFDNLGRQFPVTYGCGGVCSADLKALPAGLYFLKARTHNRTILKPFVRR